MKPVTLDEILPLGEYERVREHFRRRVIEEKQRRRVRLGLRASCVFENHDTVLFQIQEMLRTERITRPDAVRHEIETYNELIPPPGALSATVMIEIDDKAERDAFLTAARGLERAIFFAVDGERFAPRVSPSRMLDDRASAVMYLQFALSSAAQRSVATGHARLGLEADHPAYSARVDLPHELAASLALDLAE